MKNIIIFSILIFSFFVKNEIFGQYFTTTLESDEYELIIKIKPTGGDITTGFSVIEFFIRTPTSTGPFNIGTITRNLVDFPDISSLDYIGMNVQGHEPGYNNHWFSFNLGAAAATSKTYTNGVEYAVFKVALEGGTGQASFQVVANEWYTNTYLALTAPNGTELTDYSNLFYGSGIGSELLGDGSTTYWEQQDNVYLPITLTNLTAERYANTSSLISWNSFNDVNFDRFEIERSTDSNNWIFVNSVLNKSNAQGTKYYSYIDQDVYNGEGNQTFYYRLKMVDLDGQYEYSDSRSVNFDSKEFVGLDVFPNPSSDKVYFNLKGIKKGSELNVRLLDNLGKTIISKKVIYQSNNNLIIDNSSNNFKSGVYHFIIEDEKGKKLIKKIVLTK